MLNSNTMSPEAARTWDRFVSPNGVLVGADRMNLAGAQAPVSPFVDLNEAAYAVVKLEGDLAVLVERLCGPEPAAEGCAPTPPEVGTFDAVRNRAREIAAAVDRMRCAIGRVTAQLP